MAKVILTVDDSTSVRQLVNFTLAQGGYTVVEAIDGQDALMRLSPQMNLVITDLNMPISTESDSFERSDPTGLLKVCRSLCSQPSLRRSVSRKAGRRAPRPGSSSVQFAVATGDALISVWVGRSLWVTASSVGESAGWEVGTAAKCFSS
jgi:CheY-like chemotaxis protein